MLAISLASIPMTALASDRNTNPQSRVITTNICIDSLVVALIGTKNLVAVSALADDDRYSHISDKVKDLQKVAFNAEMIYALDPSLVLASNFSSAKTKSALKKLGVNVRLISFARSVEDIEKNNSELAQFKLTINKKYEEYFSLISTQIDHDQNWSDAAISIDKLYFIEKLLQKINNALN